MRPTGRDGRKDGRLEIPLCVLQDIGPLGPLPIKDIMDMDIRNGPKFYFRSECISVTFESVVVGCNCT